jgi:hypothetical protein
MVAFDRDLGGVTAQFFVDKGSRDTLIYANTQGRGWWQYDPPQGLVDEPHSDDNDSTGRWVEVEKPSKERGNEYQVNRIDQPLQGVFADDDIARLFGRKPIEAARKMGIALDDRQFRVIPTYKGKSVGMGSPGEKSHSVALLMDVFIPAEDWGDDDDRPVTDSYEWDERSNKWKGPF